LSAGGLYDYSQLALSLCVLKQVKGLEESGD